MSKSKKEFVLDCCNPITSRLRAYESSKDVYLKGYFALKNMKHPKTSKARGVNFSGNVRKKQFSKPYLDGTPGIKHSYTTKSLPPIDLRKTALHPMSKAEFQTLISKYRAIV